MNHRPKTRIPVKKPSKENDEDDVMSLSNTTSTSINPNYERITYYPRGQNWRKMFDDEFNCDITIDVDGNVIKAHKSVLISRCQYFAAMFSGKSKDSINIMYLDGFSYECVYFALCQIYSGNTDVPQNIDIFELADLADLLNLEGLKELVSHILELEYFHSFHRPCDECIFLVSKFLPWSGTIGYTDIYYKILAWVEKYCDEIWSKKEFALLPYDVIKKCFIHHTLDIDTENVLEVVQRCEKLMFTLPKVAWTANIFRLSLQLLRDCVHYISVHLADVLSTEAFLLLGKAGTEEILRLEDRMTAAIEHANPLQVCAAYAQLHRLLRAPSDQIHTEWRDLLARFAIHCEDALVCCASQAMSTSAWVSLQPDLQARIRTYSGIITSSTFSKYLNNTNKCTRERNVERIKYILYSQLGNINRVPTNASRQHLPAPTASKRFFVAPGNSMVSSTKTANISNMQNSQTLIPTIHNSQYKNVKPRYLNPKPVKNPNVDPSKKPAIPQNVMLNGKKMSKPNNSAKVKDVCKKNVCKTSYVRDSSSAQKNNFENRLNSGSFNSNQKAIELKKPKCSIDHGENQTKTLVKNPPIFYVSPYSFKPSDNLKSQKNTSQMIGKIYNSQKSVEKHKEGLKVSSMHIEKNRSLTESMSVEKRNISVSDTALSIDTKKNFKDSPRSTYNKSPTFKRSTHENSSSYSSPVSHSSVKTNSTIFGSPKLKREIPNQNIIKSFSTKDVAKSKCSNFKGKSLPTFAQSTVSSSAKIIQKSVNEFIPNSQALNSAKTANICDIIDIPLKNLDDSLPNENNVCTLMSRSRTFLKKEPSIISKEITLDSSIEMYPE